MYFQPTFDRFPVDIYGSFRNFPDAQENIDGSSSRGSFVNYCGQVDHEQLIELIGKYIFSFVAWLPNSESTYYAAPNKFFDAITANTPPLVAPHPLCVRLIRRYGCGQVLNSWEEPEIEIGFERAYEFAHTDAYQELVEHKLPFAAKELTWKSQFQKLANLLDDIASGA
jgi:hypothetical protein